MRTLLFTSQNYNTIDLNLLMRRSLSGIISNAQSEVLTSKDFYYFVDILNMRITAELLCIKPYLEGAWIK